jgi:phosphoribosylformylglycinamidine synthase
MTRPAPTRSTSASRRTPGSPCRWLSIPRTWRRRSSPTGAPAVAMLREQGVNGQLEMAAAFHRAGFARRRAHERPRQRPAQPRASFRAWWPAAVFPYGDVLGAGEGWAKSILFNRRLREHFAASSSAEDSFALGVCNGCQMLSNLRELIPGSRHWPRFRAQPLRAVRGPPVPGAVRTSPPCFLAGMEGSRLPIVVAHGEGRAEFAATAPLERLRGGGTVSACATWRTMVRDGRALSRQPQRVPRRHYRRVQRGRAGHHHDAAPGACHPYAAVFLGAEDWGEDTPWLRLLPMRGTTWADVRRGPLGELVE